MILSELKEDKTKKVMSKLNKTEKVMRKLNITLEKITRRVADNYGLN